MTPINTGLHTINLSCIRNNIVLFQWVTINLLPGQGLIVQGSNGSGKTSLLRMLAGLTCPEGHIQWQGQSIYSSLPLYYHALHYLGHHHGVKNYLSVRENILYSQSLASPHTDDKNGIDALRAVQLLDEQHTLVQHLSAGQKRRLAIARLLATPKPLWILDEPFTNLDQDGHSWFCVLLEKHLQEKGIAIVASHHSLSFKEEKHLQILEIGHPHV